MHVASASATPVSALMGIAIAAVSRAGLRPTPYPCAASGAGAGGNLHRRSRASRPQPAAVAGDTTTEVPHVA